MGMVQKFRRALADLGFALIVLRREGEQLVAEDVEPGPLPALAVVWDDDETVVRRRICLAMMKLGEAGLGQRPEPLAKTG